MQSLWSMRRFLFVALFLTSALSSASEVTVSFHTGISLRTALPSTLDAEMQVLPAALLSENGVRNEATDTFRPFASLVLNARYIVRGNHLVEYVVSVKKMSGDRVTLDVVPRHPHDGEEPPLKARYHLSSYQIGDTEPAQPSFPELRLYTDGTYRMGGAHGSWCEREGHLALDGYYEAWGVAELTDEKVVFKFPRGGTYVEATLLRVTEAASR